MNFKLLKNPDGSENTQMVLMTKESGSKVWVPNDMDNRDWAAYQAWLADGNEPEAAE